MIFKLSGFFCLLLSIIITGCSSDLNPNPSPDAAPDVTTTSGALTYLPKATGNVVGTTTETRNVPRNITRAATTGLVVSSAGQSTFQSGNSKAMCETANAVKSVLEDVSQPDKILCYISAMASNNVISNNLVDGNWHYLQLINLPQEGDSNTNTTPYVKFRIILTNGAISDFKMFSCFGGSSASPTQTEYIDQTFTSSNVSIIAKNIGSSNSQNYSSSTTATGTLNTSGNWTSKNITGKKYSRNNQSEFEIKINGSQTASSLTIAAYQKGNFGSNSFGNTFYSVFQILGSDKLNTLAIGVGSTKFSFTHNNNTAITGNESWTGDNLSILSPPTSSTYYSSANNGTLLTVPTSATAVTMTSDQTWDCSLPSGSTWIQANFNDGGSAIQTAMNSCESEVGFGNRNWIECSSLY